MCVCVVLGCELMGGGEVRVEPCNTGSLPALLTKLSTPHSYWRLWSSNIQLNIQHPHFTVVLRQYSLLDSSDVFWQLIPRHKQQRHWCCNCLQLTTTYSVTCACSSLSSVLCSSINLIHCTVLCSTQYNIWSVSTMHHCTLVATQAASWTTTWTLLYIVSK